MNSPDDTLLMAYVDGELDAEDVARVERLLETDPQARQTVRALTTLGGMLSAAYADTLREPVPGHLCRAANDAADAHAKGAQPTPAHLSWRVPRLAAAAAVPLLIALGGAAGVLWQGQGDTPQSESATTARAAAFLEEKRQQALETHLSGDPLQWAAAGAPVGPGDITPLKTYRADGGYCREYREAITTPDGPRTTIGLACRKNGAWRVRYELKMGENT